MTYIRAKPTHADILDGLRGGRIFVTTGDLISELDVIAVTATRPHRRADLGGELSLSRPSDVRVTVRFRDPAGPNHHGDRPSVVRVDLIVGDITGRVEDRSNDVNPSTRVAHRFTAAEWTRRGDVVTMSVVLRNVATSSYIRVRGTNTAELEPLPDARGEDPWTDLWFYSNPIFITLPKG